MFGPRRHHRTAQAPCARTPQQILRLNQSVLPHPVRRGLELRAFTLSPCRPLTNCERPSRPVSGRSSSRRLEVQNHAVSGERQHHRIIVAGWTIAKAYRPQQFGHSRVMNLRRVHFTRIWRGTILRGLPDCSASSPAAPSVQAAHASLCRIVAGEPRGSRSRCSVVSIACCPASPSESSEGDGCDYPARERSALPRARRESTS